MGVSEKGSAGAPDSAAAPSARAGPGKLASDDLSRLSDQVADVLKVGVLVATVFLTVGMGLAAATAPSGASLTPTFSLRTWGSWSGLPLSELLVAIGLVVLVATPVARVVLSLETFARLGERDYLGVVGFVLVVLLVGIVVGLWA